MKAIFNKYFSSKSVVQILVCSLCAIFLMQRLKYQQNKITRRLGSASPARSHWEVSSQTSCVTQIPTLVTWSISHPSQAVPRYHPCKVAQDLKGQNGHMCTGCPAPALSCSLLSCNQGFKSGSDFCWHSFKCKEKQILALCDNSISANGLHGL